MKDPTLSGCRAIEMAFFETGIDGHPVFETPDFPFIQANRLELSFTDGETLHVLTSQNDDTWCLFCSYSDDYAMNRELKHDKDSIFRLREGIDLPLGQIQHVEVKLDEKSDVTEIWVKTPSGSFIMKAGEVNECSEGNHYVVGQDESVLLFLDDVSFSQVYFRGSGLFRTNRENGLETNSR